MKENSVRRYKLDERLKAALREMLEEGYFLSPISYASVQKRIGVGCRRTLTVKHRAELIKAARMLQLKTTGLGLYREKGTEAIAGHAAPLKLRAGILEVKRDALIEKLQALLGWYPGV